METKAENRPEISYIREVFTYSEGVFFWRVSPSPNAQAGALAGYRHKKSGRWRIKVFDRTHYRSHLVFAWKWGRWPQGQIDHQDGNQVNDRWENLRECTPSQNRANVGVMASNKSGLKGVVYRPNHLGMKPYYEARIRKDGKRHHLGCFKTAAEAYEAYCDAARRLHGRFARF
jgi:hypothetical protein